MDKVEYLGVNKLFVKKVSASLEIHNTMVNALSDSASSQAMILTLALECTSIEVDPRNRRPTVATTSDVMKQFPYVVLEDRRLIVDGISESRRLR